MSAMFMANICLGTSFLWKGFHILRYLDSSVQTASLD